MRTNKQQFLFAVRGSGGWFNRMNGKVIHKGLAGIDGYCFRNDHGDFEFIEHEIINDVGFIQIPRICTGYAEIAFLREYQRSDQSCCKVYNRCSNEFRYQFV